MQVKGIIILLFLLPLFLIFFFIAPVIRKCAKEHVVKINDAIFMLYMCFNKFCRQAQALDNACEQLEEYAILNVEDQGGTIFKDFAVPLNFLA